MFFVKGSVMHVEEIRDLSRHRFWPNEKHLFPVALIHQALTDSLPHYTLSGRYAKNPNFWNMPGKTASPIMWMEPLLAS
jgi:hypothetical protein